MSTNLALTPEQQRFAADNHKTVEYFLSRNRLNFDKYYDVVIFGYLRAVRLYLERPDLQEYSFVTIAKWAMSCSLSNDRRNQCCQKRYADIVSFDEPLYNDSSLTIADTVGAPAPQLKGLELDLLWNEIESRITEEELSILRMRTEGFTYGEIAKYKHMPFQDIHAVILNIRESVGEIFEPAIS